MQRVLDLLEGQGEVVLGDDVADLNLIHRRQSCHLREELAEVGDKLLEVDHSVLPPLHEDLDVVLLLASELHRATGLGIFDVPLGPSGVASRAEDLLLALVDASHEGLRGRADDAEDGRVNHVAGLADLVPQFLKRLLDLFMHTGKVLAACINALVHGGDALIEGLT